MKFEVIGSDGRCKMSTTDKSCIPIDDLDAIHSAGYTFKLDNKKVAKSTLLAALGKLDGDACNCSAEVKPSSKSVRCVDLDKIFKNQAEAARELGIDPAAVSDSIKTGRPRSGYTFERIGVI